MVHRLQLPAVRSDCDRAVAEAEFYQELGARARALREQLGLTKAETARRAGLRRSEISRLEQGLYMNTRQFLALRGAFG